MFKIWRKNIAKGWSIRVYASNVRIIITNVNIIVNNINPPDLKYLNFKLINNNKINICVCINFRCEYILDYNFIIWLDIINTKKGEKKTII